MARIPHAMEAAPQPHPFPGHAPGYYGSALALHRQLLRPRGAVDSFPFHHSCQGRQERLHATHGVRRRRCRVHGRRSWMEARARRRVPFPGAQDGACVICWRWASPRGHVFDHHPVLLGASCRRDSPWRRAAVHHLRLCSVRGSRWILFCSVVPPNQRRTMGVEHCRHRPSGARTACHLVVLPQHYRLGARLDRCSAIWHRHGVAHHLLACRVPSDRHWWNCRTQYGNAVRCSLQDED
mmetsp:Transcript_44960/g.66159  ORF Transcript_44960/g.66159 Transcript_44960/m.66159 type:complete len:238 (+) Transcript_44960:676-1389(+)